MTTGTRKNTSNSPSSNISSNTSNRSNRSNSCLGELLKHTEWHRSWHCTQVEKCWVFSALLVSSTTQHDCQNELQPSSIIFNQASQINKVNLSGSSTWAPPLFTLQTWNCCARQEWDQVTSQEPPQETSQNRTDVIQRTSILYGVLPLNT